MCAQFRGNIERIDISGCLFVTFKHVRIGRRQLETAKSLSIILKKPDIRFRQERQILGQREGAQSCGSVSEAQIIYLSHE